LTHKEMGVKFILEITQKYVCLWLRLPLSFNPLAHRLIISDGNAF
jgi:hypothetical protein